MLNKKMRKSDPDKKKNNEKMLQKQVTNLIQSVVFITAAAATATEDFGK